MKRMCQAWMPISAKPGNIPVSPLKNTRRVGPTMAHELHNVSSPSNKPRPEKMPCRRRGKREAAQGMLLPPIELDNAIGGHSPTFKASPYAPGNKELRRGVAAEEGDRSAVKVVVVVMGYDYGVHSRQLGQGNGRRRESLRAMEAEG